MLIYAIGPYNWTYRAMCYFASESYCSSIIKIMADKIALFVSLIVSSGAQHYIEENGICEYPAPSPAPDFHLHAPLKYIKRRDLYGKKRHS